MNDLNDFDDYSTLNIMGPSLELGNFYSSANGKMSVSNKN